MHKSVFKQNDDNAIAISAEQIQYKLKISCFFIAYCDLKCCAFKDKPNINVCLFPQWFVRLHANQPNRQKSIFLF